MNLPTKPFTVTCGDLRLRFTPDLEDGGFTVVALNRKGVYSQGDTFEEALSMVVDADRMMAEDLAERANARTKRHPKTSVPTQRKRRASRSRALTEA